MNINYLSIDKFVETHKQIIEISGGLSGVKNIGSLESIVELVKNNDYYPNIIDKTTHIVYSVCKNHGFNDGNKRTSIALGSYFLKINGYSYCTDTFIEEMEDIILAVAKNYITKDELAQVIDCIVADIDYTDEVNLILIRANIKK